MESSVDLLSTLARSSGFLVPAKLPLACRRQEAKRKGSFPGHHISDSANPGAKPFLAFERKGNCITEPHSAASRLFLTGKTKSTKQNYSHPHSVGISRDLPLNKRPSRGPFGSGLRRRALASGQNVYRHPGSRLLRFAASVFLPACTRVTAVRTGHFRPDLLGGGHIMFLCSSAVFSESWLQLNLERGAPLSQDNTFIFIK